MEKLNNDKIKTSLGKYSFPRGSENMRKVLFSIVLILLFSLLLQGCIYVESTDSDNTSNNESEPILVLSFSDRELDEGYYWYNTTAISVSKPGKLIVYFDLKHWDEDYALDIMVMTTGDFSNYEAGKTYYRQIDYAIKKGLYKFEFTVQPGYYVLVVDNTNSESDTDFDLENDYAIFDIEVYYQPSE